MLFYLETKEVKVLVEAAEWIIKEYLGKKIPVPLFEGEEMNVIEDMLSQVLYERIDKGYYREDVINSKRSLIFKGAYLMIWKVL